MLDIRRARIVVRSGFYGAFGALIYDIETLLQARDSLQHSGDAGDSELLAILITFLEINVFGDAHTIGGADNACYAESVDDAKPAMVARSVVDNGTRTYV